MPSKTFVGRKKSMLSFNASKDKIILLLRTNVAGDFKLKSTLISHSKFLGPLNKSENHSVISGS